MTASDDEKKAIAFLLLGLLIVLCEGFFRYRVFGDE
jgi:hypothetical protein